MHSGIAMAGRVEETILNLKLSARNDSPAHEFSTNQKPVVTYVILSH
jgi:hypothetical protein